MNPLQVIADYLTEQQLTVICNGHSVVIHEFGGNSRISLLSPDTVAIDLSYDYQQLGDRHKFQLSDPQLFEKIHFCVTKLDKSLKEKARENARLQQ